MALCGGRLVRARGHRHGVGTRGRRHLSSPNLKAPLPQAAMRSGNPSEKTGTPSPSRCISAAASGTCPISPGPCTSMRGQCSAARSLPVASVSVDTSSGSEARIHSGCGGSGSRPARSRWRRWARQRRQYHGSSVSGSAAMTSGPTSMHSKWNAASHVLQQMSVPTCAGAQSNSQRSCTAHDLRGRHRCLVHAAVVPRRWGVEQVSRRSLRPRGAAPGPSRTCCRGRR